MSERRGKSRAYAPVLSALKRAILVIAIVIISACAFKGLGIIHDKKTEKIDMSLEIERLEDRIKAEEEKNDELSKNRDSKVSDEEYESLAREELGLIKNDEIIIKPR